MTGISIVISSGQRKLLVLALGHLALALTSDAVFKLTGAEFDVLLSQLIEARESAAPAAPLVVERAAPELRTRWARNKKGEEAPHPEGCEEFSVDISKIAAPKPSATGSFVKVTWSAANGNGFVDASCWDEKLWPFLANRLKRAEKTSVYLVRNGEYLNIVGVRA